MDKLTKSGSLKSAESGRDVARGRAQAFEYEMIVAIVGRGFSDYVVSAARDAGATGATIIYGRGTDDFNRSVMGISLQPEREVVLVVVKASDRRAIMQAILNKTSVIEEGRGVCFSLPVTEVYGLGNVAKQKAMQIRRAKELERESRHLN